MGRWWLLLFIPSLLFANSYTVLNKQLYRETLAVSRQRIEHLLLSLQSQRHNSLDQQTAFIVHQLEDTPWLANGMGEGDWQPAAIHYQPGALHINQNPVYRLDGMDCQTLVQMVLTLLLSHDLAEFDQHYLAIAYGAAGNPDNEIVPWTGSLIT